MKTLGKTEFSPTSFWVLLISFVLVYHRVHSQLISSASGPILFSDGKTLAEVVLSSAGEIVKCRLYELEAATDAEAIIKNSGLPVKFPSFKGMLQLVNNCSHLQKRKTPGLEEAAPPTEGPPDPSKWSSWALWNGIVPGTKWCGMGDIASSFEDLGSQTEVDACCRAHDHCPIKLKAFRADYGLINLSLYTKSHCDCDREFHVCLKQTINKFADMVGNFYFNFMRVQCIKEYRPFICVQNRTELNGNQECVRWSVDLNNSKMQVTVTQLKY